MGIRNLFQTMKRLWFKSPFGISFAAFTLTVATFAYSQVTSSTSLGRLEILFPDFNHQGGTSLHTKYTTFLTKLSDSMNGRYEAFTSVNNSTVSTFRHNYGVPFSELCLLLYSGTALDFTRISDPAGSGWTIAANVTNPKLEIDITTPSSGQPHDFALITAVGQCPENLTDLGDVNTAGGEEGQALVLQSGVWVPGASGDSSFKIQDVTDPNITIKSGNLILQDGRELQLAADLTTNLDSTIGSPFTVDACNVVDAPDDQTCYLYLDETQLPTESIVADRTVLAVNVSDFKISAFTPSELDMKRFIPVGYIHTADTGNAWSGTGASFGTLAVRRHSSKGSLIKTDLNDAYTDTLQGGRHYLVSITSAKTLTMDECLVNGQKILVQGAGVDIGTNNLTIDRTLTDVFRRGTLTDPQYIYDQGEATQLEFTCDADTSAWLVKEQGKPVAVQTHGDGIEGTLPGVASDIHGAKTFQDPILLNGSTTSTNGDINSNNAISTDDVVWHHTINGVNSFGLGVDSDNFVVLGTLSGVDTWNLKALRLASGGFLEIITPTGGLCGEGNNCSGNYTQTLGDTGTGIVGIPGAAGRDLRWSRDGGTLTASATQTLTLNGSASPFFSMTLPPDARPPVSFSGSTQCGGTVTGYRTSGTGPETLSGIIESGGGTQRAIAFMRTEGAGVPSSANYFVAYSFNCNVL